MSELKDKIDALGLRAISELLAGLRSFGRPSEDKLVATVIVCSAEAICSRLDGLIEALAGINNNLKPR